MLDQKQRDQLGAKILEIAIYYAKDFSKEQVSMFINVLEKYMPNTLENYFLAIDRYCMDSKNRFFPSPMQLKTYLENKVSVESISIETASRIRMAITKFGWNNYSEAKEFMGELGCMIVDRCGGWQYLCENHGLDLNPLTFHAQIRDLAKSLIETNEKSTIIENQIGFSNQNVLNLPQPKQIPK